MQAAHQTIDNAVTQLRKTSQREAGLYKLDEDEQWTLEAKIVTDLDNIEVIMDKLTRTNARAVFDLLAQRTTMAAEALVRLTALSDVTELVEYTAVQKDAPIMRLLKEVISNTRSSMKRVPGCWKFTDREWKSVVLHVASRTALLWNHLRNNYDPAVVLKMLNRIGVSPLDMARIVIQEGIMPGNLFEVEEKQATRTQQEIARALDVRLGENLGKYTWEHRIFARARIPSLLARIRAWLFSLDSVLLLPLDSMNPDPALRDAGLAFAELSALKETLEIVMIGDAENL